MDQKAGSLVLEEGVLGLVPGTQAKQQDLDVSIQLCVRGTIKSLTCRKVDYFGYYVCCYC